MTSFFRLFLVKFSLATSCILSIGHAAEAVCEVDRPVIFAGLDWDSNTLHKEIASFIIEHGYGCEPDSIPGATMPLFNGMAAGVIDITMEVWRENMLQDWQKRLTEKTVIDLGSNFPDARQAWFVPKYINDETATKLQSVQDLHQYLEHHKSEEVPFYNCPRNWACAEVNTRKLKAYGLTEKLTNIRKVDTKTLNQEIEAKLAKRTPIVLFHWTPSWVMGKYGKQVIELQEKPYNAKTWYALTHDDAPTQATAYPVINVHIAASASFARDAPKIIDFLKKYQTSTEELSEMLLHRHNTQETFPETARYFLRTKTAQWEKWVPKDVAARVKEALKEMDN